MKKAYEFYQNELSAIREAGTYKDERIIVTPQRSRIDTTLAKGVVNMCANNYLGLSDNPDLIAAAKASYDEWGFGLSSVRFICGTQDIHKQLEGRIARFVGMEDAILYSSCFDANERGPLRDPAGARGRHHLRRAEPRLHHRRHPPLQGEAVPL